VTASATAYRPYADALLRYGAEHDDVVCLAGDLTASCEIDAFRDAFPARFINVGMAEQNMMGIAGGLAKAGLFPLVHTFGVFATRRPLDQVEMAIALPRVRARIMGFLPGLTTPGGPTHQAIDDVSIMRALPGMTVLDPGDATEISSALVALDSIDGPAYCRVMRGDVPVLFDTPLEVGRVRTLSEGNDLCLVSSSITTGEAMRAAEVLAADGVSVAHLHVSTLEPLDDPALPAAIAGTKAVVTLENHLTTGGLGSAVAEVMAEAGIGRRLVRLGLRDTYATGGSQEYLFGRFGLDAGAVLRAAGELLGERFAAEAGSAPAGGEGDVERQEAL